MALTRKMLKAMGIEDEKIDQIIEEHSETVEALKHQRDEFKQQAEELPKAKQRLKELEAVADESDLQEKYDKLEKEFTDYKSNVEKEKTQGQIKDLYKALLRESGVDEKRVNTVLKATDLSGLEITKNGTLKDSDGLKASITEEWGDFITTTEKRGADVEKPPAGGSSGKTKEEILAIKDTGERQDAIAENHELFGF